MKTSNLRDQVLSETYFFKSLIAGVNHEVKEAAKGNFPAVPFNRGQILNVTNNRPFSFPSLAAMNKVEMQETDLRNYLLYWFPRMVITKDVEKPLYVAMKEEEASFEEMDLFLSSLGFFETLDCSVDEILFLRGLAYPKMCKKKKYGRLYPGYEGQISLTQHGIEFIKAARHIYLTYGYKLVMKNFPELTYSSYVRN